MYLPEDNFIEEESRRGTKRYTYDCFNRTESVRTAEGGYIRNRYDPEGLRYKLYENGKVIWFIFSGREVVTEVDDNYGLKAAIIRGHEILAQKDNKDSSYYYFNNAHGDVTALLDGRGEIVNRYKYDAFGNTVEAVEKVHNRFRYAGEQFDPVTGQYYLRARFYNPVIGRFTQEDTYRGDGLNLYAYVQNNPVNYCDPSGYEGEKKSCELKSNFGNGEGLSGNNWKFDPSKDVDWRGTGKTYRDALDEAFRRTGLSKDQFEVTKWGKDRYGKSIPVEWQGPNGANVNMDIPEWNNVKPDGTLGAGPFQPHIGYQTPGKGSERIRGHIFVDYVPATRS